MWKAALKVHKMAPFGKEGPESFPQTQWSLVGRAGVSDQQGRRQALGQLLPMYLPAMRAHLLAHKGLSPEQADDVIQEFVARKILEKNLIGQADRQLGKFRTFLLTALDRFLLNWLRDHQSARRSPTRPMVALEDQAEPASRDERPSDAFDVAWARQVIAKALRQMRAECEAAGRREVWAMFECRVVGPILEGKPPTDYRDLVQRFGLHSPTQASNLLVTAKRMYARALRAVIAQYAADEEEIDSELAELQAVLALSLIHI